MSISSPDSPPIEVPEADWAEQAVAADPWPMPRPNQRGTCEHSPRYP